MTAYKCLLIIYIIVLNEKSKMQGVIEADEKEEEDTLTSQTIETPAINATFQQGTTIFGAESSSSEDNKTDSRNNMTTVGNNASQQQVAPLLSRRKTFTSGHWVKS